MGIYNRRRKKEIAYERKPESNTSVSKNLDDNIARIKEAFSDCNDLVYREFNVGGPDGQRMFLCYIDGMADKIILDEFLLTPVMISSREVPPDFDEVKNRLYKVIKSSAMSVSDIKDVESIEDILLAVMSGEAAVLIDGYDKCIILAVRSWPARGPSEPTSETIIRGPRDGFTETIRFNTALVRRRIRDTKFKVKQIQIGRRSKTDIAILYIDDIVDKRILGELNKRLDKIDIDAVIESGYIEQFIQDRQFSPFPQVQATERPDTVAASVYEGRVGILVDNSPYALLVPATVDTFLQSAEDYYTRPVVSTFLRNIRLISVILSVVAPSFYIALISFNPGILPGKLLLSISASREGVPFPAFLEALIMELTFELLREAGVRLPRAIGSTIGIVGGLVIGQAAVSAGIVSPIMVIVVSVTAIASFAIPNYEVAAGFRLVRFILMILAAIYGLYGTLIGLIGTLIHLVNLKSFDVPYLAPIAPFHSGDIKDTAFVVTPWKYMKKRPDFLDPQDKIRQGGDNDDSQ